METTPIQQHAGVAKGGRLGGTEADTHDVVLWLVDVVGLFADRGGGVLGGWGGDLLGHQNAVLLVEKMRHLTQKIA